MYENVWKSEFHSLSTYIVHAHVEVKESEECHLNSWDNCSSDQSLHFPPRLSILSLEDFHDKTKLCKSCNDFIRNDILRVSRYNMDFVDFNKK